MINRLLLLAMLSLSKMAYSAELIISVNFNEAEIFERSANFSPDIVINRQSYSLEDLIQLASTKKVVMIGEHHNQFSHHFVQLSIIKFLHRKNPNLAIAVEWVQRQHQETLDSYMAGNVPFPEFLEAINYNMHWGFDVRNIMPVLEYAKEEGIKIYAMDSPKWLASKIYHEGINSLDPDQVNQLPELIREMSDSQLVELKSIMAVHNVSDEKIERLVLSQRIRDAIMAEQIEKALANGGYDLVIALAGINHVLNHRGVPFALNAGFLNTPDILNVSIQSPGEFDSGRFDTHVTVVFPLMVLKD
ncbi:ChaN family lipoprotein [Thiomicrospira sp. R3]|uniref:ChaN family lipoprotein n=1 Tax=Thiomicrospira sp. R3 TaxID=3035472 RepID=UPI00259B8E07|nr:ChaN family lipoprotein [Thiomicrospira sp. R3]WFE69439.1 ChaN family lipoprotein [Thiomicrospira sp. R3]